MKTEYELAFDVGNHRVVMLIWAENFRQAIDLARMALTQASLAYCQPVKHERRSNDSIPF